MSSRDQNKSRFHGSGQDDRPTGTDPHVTHTGPESRPEKDASPPAKNEDLRALIRERLDMEANKRGPHLEINLSTATSGSFERDL